MDKDKMSYSAKRLCEQAQEIIGTDLSLKQMQGDEPHDIRITVEYCAAGIPALRYVADVMERLLEANRHRRKTGEQRISWSIVVSPKSSAAR